MPIDSQKLKVIEEAIVSIEKAYGKGSVMQLGDAPPQKIESIPTGCFSLDYALGIGGLPRGRIIEIYGPESSGKTTMCLHAIAEAQKMNGAVAFIDAEHALDLNYAQKIGVNISELFISQPDYAEQALEIVNTFVSSNAFDMIVIDSVAALVPRSEIEGEMGDAQMAVQARLMSQALRKLTGVASKSKTSIVFINQLRSKIGMVFGNPETTSGGNALKFYASVRLDIRRIANIKTGDSIIGNRTRVKVVKSKVSPPFKEAEFDILYNVGIDTYGDILDLAVNLEIIKKGGAWFAFGEDKFQGRDSIRDAMKKDPVFFEIIKQQVIEKMNTPKAV